MKLRIKQTWDKKFYKEWASIIMAGSGESAGPMWKIRWDNLNSYRYEILFTENGYQYRSIWMVRTLAKAKEIVQFLHGTYYGYSRAERERARREPV